MAEMPHTTLINRRIADAVHAWHWQEMISLLEQGGDPNLVLDGETLLSRVIATIDQGAATPAVLNALLAAGADINRIDPNGGTALHTAICRERPDLLEWLLQNGADPNTAAPNKATPLMLGVEFDMADSVDFRTRLLLAHGADPDRPYSIAGRPPESVRDYLESKAATEQVFSATGIVDTFEMASAARQLRALLPRPVPPKDIQKILRDNAAGRNLKLHPRDKGPTR